MKLLTPNIGLIFWTILVFSVLFFLLKKLAWQPILLAVNEREAEIENAIADAQKMKAELAKMKNEIEKFLLHTRNEKEQLVKEANQTACKLQSDAKEKARKECRIFVEDAIAAIEVEKKAALEQAKNQVNEIAMEASEKLLHRPLADKSNLRRHLNG